MGQVKRKYLLCQIFNVKQFNKCMNVIPNRINKFETELTVLSNSIVSANYNVNFEHKHEIILKSDSILYLYNYRTRLA